MASRTTPRTIEAGHTLVLSDHRKSPTPDSAETPAGAVSVPGHELLRRIAAGAYGEIWLARSELGSFRAVKVVRRASFSSPKPYERELAGLTRYEPVSRQHEGLVDVLQFGNSPDGGWFYYIMELADDASVWTPGRPLIRDDAMALASPAKEARDLGSGAPSVSWEAYQPLTLSHLIRRHRRLPVAQVVELGILLGKALEFLHARNLVHRDIKPSNIIFVDGQPKFADVGLVADLDHQRSLVGTEGYFPPEGPGTTQGDIYSLGKVLYEAATGKDRQEFPDLPTELGENDGGLPLEELNEVLLKACEANPRARYASAAALVDELEHVRNGGSLRRRRARSRRARGIATWVALGLGTILAVVAFQDWIRDVRSRPRFLFGDPFDSVTVDTNRWRFSQKSDGPNNPGGRITYIDQSGGELVIKASTSHKVDGETSSISGWLDMTPELRSLGACRIELTFASTIQRGRVSLALTDRSIPDLDAEPGGTKLLDWEATKGSGSRTWPQTQVRLEFFPQTKSAIIYPDLAHPDQFDVVDLRTTAGWHLRVHAFAAASQGFGDGTLQFRLKDLKVYSLTNNPFVGRVENDFSGLPVEDALIIDAFEGPVAKTLRNGAFVLPGATRAAFLRVEAEGYGPAKLELDGVKLDRAFVDVRMRKLALAIGDPVAKIRLGDIHPASIGFRSNMLMLLVEDPKEGMQLIPVDLAAMRPTPEAAISLGLGTATSNSVDEFAECGNSLLGLKRYHGEVVNLDEAPTARVASILRTKDQDVPIDFVLGVAFDGADLWFIENNPINQRCYLHRYDVAQQRVVQSIASTDRAICGLAWDRTRFWVSTANRVFYSINRKLALDTGSLEMGREGPEYAGDYSRLAFGKGQLWGLDSRTWHLRRIMITD